MMNLTPVLANQSAIASIRQRFSCRAYRKEWLSDVHADQLQAFLATLHTGPLGAQVRFRLALAMPYDPKALRGLGTYGLVKSPAGFLIGAVRLGLRNLEDFGYAMELAILYAASLGIDSCWLGGNFTKSSFAERMEAGADEIVPAVAALGYGAAHSKDKDLLRRAVKADMRLSWRSLFFQADGITPLDETSAGAYALALEMVRLAPSGHNYQPWRLLQDGPCYHFYLQRTSGYGPGTLIFRLLGIADLQRIEIGIAMCHFELAARQSGLQGNWLVADPCLTVPDGWEYAVSWRETI